MLTGCPKLKTLTLETLRGGKRHDYQANISDYFWDLKISQTNLEAGEKLKDLKLTRVLFEDIFTVDDLEKLLPDCNVEMKECEFALEGSFDAFASSDDSDDSDDSFDSDSDDWFDDYDSDNSLDVSFDDGEQDSNSESVETNDGEDNKDENGN